MSQYRLHIDIPMGSDEEKAIEEAKFFIDTLIVSHKNDTNIKFLKANFNINYRLGHDDDRQKSNYLMKNEEGHVNNKKCRLTFDEETV